MAPVDEFPTEKWDKMIALNLSATFHTTRLSIPGMKERGDHHNLTHTNHMRVHVTAENNYTCMISVQTLT